MPATMDTRDKIQPQHVIHIGTALLLCHGTRHVRVLTLPSLCNNRRLIRGWIACLGDEPNIEIDWPMEDEGRPDALGMTTDQ